jgi:hypothetical protein
VTGLHVLKGPRVPETTGDPFLCAHFRGTLTGSECLRRQTSRVKAGAMARDQTPRVPQHLQFCASGACEQGTEIAAKFPDWKPEDRPLPSWTTQMAAKRKATAALPPMRGLAVWPAPVVAVARAPEPEFHPLPKPEPEEPMAEARIEDLRRTCDEPGCTLALRSDNKTGKCKVHAQRVHHQNFLARKNGKPGASRESAGKPSLTGQDEFDLMIRIRDDFRKLSPDGQRYVLAALKG